MIRGKGGKGRGPAAQVGHPRRPARSCRRAALARTSPCRGRRSEPSLAIIVAAALSALRAVRVAPRGAAGAAGRGAVARGGDQLLLLHRGCWPRGWPPTRPRSRSRLMYRILFSVRVQLIRGFKPKPAGIRIINFCVSTRLHSKSNRCI
jgi:hypothetical protein